MKRSVMMILVLGLTMIIANGCISRAIKEGVGTATGAKGVQRPTKTPGPKHAALIPYGKFEVEEFTDDFNGSVPAALLTPIAPKIRQAIAESKALPKTGGKTLLIRGRVIYYETATMMGQAFGPFEEAITEVDFIDKASGQKIGEAICIGRSGETVNQGFDKKADGVAKAVVQYLEDYYPKPEDD